MKRILTFTVVLSSIFISCKQESDQNVIKTFVLSEDMQKKTQREQAIVRPVYGTIELTGKVIPDENNQVNIYPMIGGKVISVDVEIGDIVDTDKPLVVINSGEAREFEKELIAAKDEYELALKNYEIQQDLHKTKFSSERELAYAKKDYILAKSELARMEEVYKVYSLTVGGNYVIKSPVAGFVIEKKIGPNMQIRPDMNDYILSVARLEEVFIAFNVYETDIPFVRLGQEIKITAISYPDSVVTGTISRIENYVDPITRTVQARVRIKNRNFHFKPEMNCIGKLNYNANKKMLSVKKSALIFDKSKVFVLVYISPEKIETREVTVASESDEYAYISSGLKENEEVITTNQLFIYDALND